MLRRYLQKGQIEAGCDEAGRGCLAGPVFAAAVILPPTFRLNGLNDSKLLSPAKRETLRLAIEAKALAFAVASVDADEIDDINILNASFKAMHLALSALSQEPDCILVDGNRFHSYESIPHHCVIKGDQKFASIAAASILAKTHRDAYMMQLHEAHPEYGWQTNKGYPTRAHKFAIHEHGLTVHHRRSFNHAIQGVFF